MKQRTPLQVVLVRLHLRFSSLPVFRGSRLLVFRLRVFDLRAPPVPQRLGRRHREERQEHVRGRAEADGVGQVEKVGRVLLNVRGSRLLRASLRGSLAFALARRVRRRVGGQAHARGARSHGAGAEQLPHVLPLAFTDLERQFGLALVTRKAVVAVVAVIIQVARAWREVVRLPAETRARHCRAHAHGRPRIVPIEPLGVVRSRQNPSSRSRSSSRSPRNRRTARSISRRRTTWTTTGTGFRSSTSRLGGSFRRAPRSVGVASRRRLTRVVQI